MQLGGAEEPEAEDTTMAPAVAEAPPPPGAQPDDDEGSATEKFGDSGTVRVHAFGRWRSRRVRQSAPTSEMGSDDEEAEELPKEMSNDAFLDRNQTVINNVLGRILAHPVCEKVRAPIAGHVNDIMASVGDMIKEIRESHKPAEDAQASGAGLQPSPAADWLAAGEEQTKSGVQTSPTSQ